MNQQQQQQIKLVTILVDGKPLNVDPASIYDREVVHGKYNDERVNSPAISLVGDSVIFWPDASDPASAEAMPKADFALLAARFREIDKSTVTIDRKAA